MQTRQRIADEAARLFAARGYDEVSMSDVAEAVDVSGQTVYNYFPAKHDLVLDRAEQIRLRYDATIRSRPEGVSPAAAMAELAREDIERHRHCDPARALGEYVVLSVNSPAVRRHALQIRDEQTATIAAAITDTNPELPPAIAHTHAAALVGLFHYLTDRMGHGVLEQTAPDALSDEMHAAAEAALNDLDEQFRRLLVRFPTHGRGPARPVATPSRKKTPTPRPKGNTS